MDGYIIHNLPAIVAFIAIIATFVLNYIKEKKKDNTEDDSSFKKLEVGQTAIFGEVKALKNIITDMKKENDDLFLHKEDCLKRRSKCDSKFLTKADHDRLHTNH